MSLWLRAGAAVALFVAIRVAVGFVGIDFEEVGEDVRRSVSGVSVERRF